jgi:tripartite-type tricarboxylate transporter receptor subunit TctC
MATSGQIAINPTLFKNLPFDVISDFAPVTLAVSSTNVLVVNPSVTAKTIKELIAYARTKPAPLKYGSSGVGQASHLAGVIFEMMSGANMTHVPYKGGGPSMLALITGEVDLVFSNAVSVVPQMKAGKVRALAVTTVNRSALLPDLPTIAEAGLTGYEANNWFGVLVPAKTPRVIVTQLNREIVSILNAPDVKESLFRQGFEPSPSTPEAFGAYIKSESVKWAKVVKESGATPE